MKLGSFILPNLVEVSNVFGGVAFIEQQSSLGPQLPSCFPSVQGAQLFVHRLLLAGVIMTM